MTSDEDYFPVTRRDQRAERKHASQRDRSKYKKTDRAKMELLSAQKIEKKLQKKTALLEGRVVASSPEGYVVELNHQLFICALRGALKQEISSIKNLVVIGDFVLFEQQPQNKGVIVHVQPRQSFLSRQEHLHRRQQQLIAANIDQVLITLSVIEPPLKPALIDRYIIATLKGNMKPIVLINKIDLLIPNTPEWSHFQDVMHCYENLKIPIVQLSTKTGEGIETLQQLMQNKASVFAGQSGVGKSSLINAMTGLDLQTKGMTKKTRKGSHTTTFAQLIKLKQGGWCVDTPGIRSFGVWDLTKEELLTYFPDIARFARFCKYPDCTHRNEPYCAVATALEEKALFPFRYDSYLKLLEDFLH